MAKKTKAVTYPTKKTLNLAIKEKSPFRPQKLIPLLLVVLFAVALFAKFAVIDRLNEYYALQDQAADKDMQVARLTQELKEYPEVLEVYSRYSVSWMNADVKATVERTDILDLIEKELVPYASIRNISIAGNTVSLQLGGITLEDASQLVNNIKARDDVSNVSIYSADTKPEVGLNASISMLINVKLPEGGAK